MLFHVDARDRGFTHTYSGTAIAGNEAAQKLEQVRVVSHDQDVLPVRIFLQELLKVRIGGVEVERRADLDFAFIAEFVAHKLCGLQCSLQGTGNDDVRLNLERAEDSPHDHALFFSFDDQTAFSVELRALAGNSGIGMPHEVEVHMRGGRNPGGLSHFL